MNEMALLCISLARVAISNLSREDLVFYFTYFGEGIDLFIWLPVRFQNISDLVKDSCRDKQRGSLCPLDWLELMLVNAHTDTMVLGEEQRRLLYMMCIMQYLWFWVKLETMGVTSYQQLLKDWVNWSSDSRVWIGKKKKRQGECGFFQYCSAYRRKRQYLSPGSPATWSFYCCFRLTVGTGTVFGGLSGNTVAWVLWMGFLCYCWLFVTIKCCISAFLFE